MRSVARIVAAALFSTFQHMILRFCRLFAFGLLLAGPFGARADEAGKEFKKEILLAWDSLRQKTNSVRMEWTHEYHSSKDRQPLRLTRKDVIRYVVNPNGGKYAVEEEKYDEKMTITERDAYLEMHNQQYAANLGRTKARDGWLLTELKQTPKDEAECQKFRFSSCHPWLTCGNVWLPEWLADGSFVITRTEQLKDRAATGLVRIHFVYDEARRQFSGVPIQVQSGHIDFDPTHSYRVMGYEYQVKSKVSEYVERGVCDYDVVDGIPVLKARTRECPEVRSKFGLLHGKDVETFQIQHNVDVPDDEVRLSFYGLPEPVGVTWKKPTPTYVWLLLAAGVCATLAFGFRYVARRVRAAKS